MSADPEELPDAIIAQLGKTLDAWQSVESALFMLYMALFSEDRQNVPASIVYHSIIHIDGKLKAIDALAKHRLLQEPAKGSWANLLNRINRRKKVRDKVAHWGIGMVRGKDRHIFYFGPPQIKNLYSRTSTMDWPPPKDAMSSKDLSAHERDFSQFSNEIYRFISQHVLPSRQKWR